MSRSYAVGAVTLSLVLGFAIGRGTARIAPASDVPSSGACEAPQENSAKASQSAVAFTSAVGGSPGRVTLTAATGAATAAKAPDTHSAGTPSPQKSGSARIVLENDPKLLDSVNSPFPAERLLAKHSEDDGGYSTRESAEDGGTIEKVFNGQGTVTGDLWKQSDGGKIARTYYDTGSIKSFYDLELDGASISITFTQSGFFKSRFDKLADGETISTEYDDEGQVIDRLIKTPDGKYSRE